MKFVVVRTFDVVRTFIVVRTFVVNIDVPGKIGKTSLFSQASLSNRSNFAAKAGAIKCSTRVGSQILD